MRDRFPPLGLVVMGAVLLIPGDVEAQWSADASIGSSTHPAVASSFDTDNIVGALRYLGSLSLDLVAGAPLGGDSQGWGSARVRGRHSNDGSPAVGIAGSAEVYGFGESTRLEADWGTILDASALVEFERGGHTIEVSAGPLLTWTESAGDTRLFLLSAAAGTARLGAVSIYPVARLIVSDAGSFPYAGVSAGYDRGAIGGWAGGGIWTSGPAADEAVDWSLGSYWNPTRRLQVFASFDRTAPDPIFAAAARNTWSIGASVAFGRHSQPLPVPVQPFGLPSGTVEIELQKSEVRGQPMLAGDFNGWTPQVMTAEGDRWVAHLNLEPGVYHYSFVTEGGRWFLPASVEYRTEDPFGGENGVLVVR